MKSEVSNISCDGWSHLSLSNTAKKYWAALRSRQQKELVQISPNPSFFLGVIVVSSVKESVFLPRT
jgi:hypothetical protein